MYRRDAEHAEIDVICLHEHLCVLCVSAAHSVNHRRAWAAMAADRKSTRLNSSHANISYAAFCLKKKNVPRRPQTDPKVRSAGLRPHGSHAGLAAHVGLDESAAAQIASAHIRTPASPISYLPRTP